MSDEFITVKSAGAPVKAAGLFATAGDNTTLFYGGAIAGHVTDAGAPVLASNAAPLPVKIAAVGPVTIEVNEADLANVGAKADTAWAGSGDGSLIAIAKAEYAKLEAMRALLAGTLTVTSAQNPAAVTATIANGQSLSGALDLGATRAARITIPGTWTTANLTFQTSYDGTNYADLYDSYGNEVVVTVGGASRAIYLPAIPWSDVRWLKVRSGTTGTPVNQAAARSLPVVVRSL